jgi:hypothetical protein
MIISIRTHIGCRNIAELNRRARAKLLPVIRELAGFKSIKLVKLDEDTVSFVIMFEEREQAEVANEQVQKIIQTELAELLPAPAEVLLGDVLWETRW